MEKDLNGYKILGVKTIVLLKSKSFQQFHALIKHVEIGIDNPRVTFTRSDDTDYFPINENDFVCYVKDVKKADFDEADFLEKINSK